MSGDWRAAHRADLLDKQRHISQKLAQIREFQALVRKWRRKIRQLEDWFSGLETSANGSKYFSVQSLIRMGSITVQLTQLIGEFEQIGDPKTTGSGTASSTTAAATGAATAVTPPTTKGRHLTDQELAGVTADALTARAGPLASSAPWELVWYIDPATSEAVRRGEYGVAITNVLCNPFTSLAAVGFAEGIGDEAIRLLTEHKTEFENLESGWNATQGALESMNETLGGIDLAEMSELEDSLERVLHDYEAAYDGATGVDETSAHRLRQNAATPTTTR